MTDTYAYRFEPQTHLFEDEIDSEIMEESEYDIIIDMIDNLYSVIQKFQSGNAIVSNPCVIPYMTKNDFVSWIVNNNEYVSNILNHEQN